MKLGIIAEGVQTSLAAKLASLRPAIAAAAQQVYDSWQPGPEGDPELGDGGICDQIAMEMSIVMSAEGIDVTEGGHEGDDHAYLVAYDENESFSVDIDPRHYESGGGYSWTKSPDVTFSPEMVSIDEVQRPDWIEDEYGGLEDADEFGVETKSDLMRRYAEMQGIPVQDIRMSSSNPEDFLGIPRINESYDELEDADEFEDPQPVDECWGCVQHNREAIHHQDDMDGPCNCGVCWCDWCVSKTEPFEWIPEFDTEGRENRNAGEMVGCPRCLNQQIQENSEYAGLEDNDEFEIKSGMTNPVIHIGEYVLSGTYYGDPRDQADVYVNGLHIGDYNDSQMRPLLHLILKRFPQLKIHAEEHGSDVLASISDIAQYLFFANEVIEESEYSGLEDADEFGEDPYWQHTWPELHFQHYVISGRWSGDEDDDIQISIMDNARWPHWELVQEFDQEAQGHSSLAPLLQILQKEYPQIDLADLDWEYEPWEAVNHITQFLFFNGDWDQTNPDTGHPPVTESVYAGLEDADEFREPSDDCMHCGAEFNPHAGGYRQGAYIYQCHNCENKSCEQCMDANGWEYDYATDTGSTATCPNCLAAYNTP